MMTISIEAHIEELKAELRNAPDAAERRQIATEIELAQAEFELMLAEQVGNAEPEPPF